MNAVSRAIWNPIVAKEYRSRMRTWRSPLAMTIFIVLLGGLGWAVFSAISTNGGAFGLSGSGGNYGQILFTFLIIFQIGLLAFITPALTAGAISGERERQTIDLLFVTRIPPFSIIWGKLLSSMSFIVMLLLLSVPIFSLVFLFGGIEVDQLLYAFLVTAVTALTLGTLGLAFSTLFRRTLAATVAAYGAAFVLLVGTLVYGLLFPTDADPAATTAPAPPAITMLSPVLPLLTIASGQPIQGYGVRYAAGGPGFNSVGTSCTFQPNGTQVCFSGSIPAGGAAPIFAAPPATGSTVPSGLFQGWQYWQASVAMQLAICALALAISALLLPPVRRLPFRQAVTSANQAGMSSP
jgi:ABC-type transport system involved in multi-copper enzyme maturation permease subunit